MAGVFGQWQPAYAEAGIASFPVDGTAKKPAVGNYLRAGFPASLQWARRFPDASGLGFACGPRNRITVVDIDEPGEGLLADVLDRLGPTPIIVQTASGKHHAWYRHNGEGRKIRADGFSGPVDILGKGYAIAPPSRSNGGEYRFLRGSLADVAALPVIAPLRAPQAATEPSDAVADSVPIGQRNHALYRACMAQAKLCRDEGELLTFAADHNLGQFFDPLPADEVGEVVKKVWARTLAGENWFGEGQRVSMPLADMDALLTLGPDAFHLEMFLRRHHWGLREYFVIANALADHMPGGKWTLRRFVAARSALLRAGRIVLVRPASRATGPALYRFS